MAKLKRIYFANSSKMFEGESGKRLQIEAMRHNIIIGDEVNISDYVTIMDSVTIGYASTIGGYSKILNNSTLGSRTALSHNVAIGYDVTIGDNVTISAYSTIGYDATLGNNITIGYDSTIGNNVIIADNVTILERAVIEDGWEIKNIIHLMNEYKYNISGYLIKGVIIIQMGCYTRTLEEWELDFWNNDREFKRGTPEGEERLRAFNKIKKIMKG